VSEAKFRGVPTNLFRRYFRATRSIKRAAQYTVELLEIRKGEAHCSIDLFREGYHGTAPRFRKQAYLPLQGDNEEG
jgi:hypothetical protein